MSRDMKFPTMCNVRPAKAQTSAVLSDPLLIYSMRINYLLFETHLEFLRLREGCIGSSESIHVNMPHCWKTHVTTQMNITY